MMSWLSLVAVLFVVGLLVVGWSRGWSLVLTLIIAMGGPFVLGLATASRLGGSIVGSPLLEDLAWRPAYLSLEAWSHWPTAITTMFLHADVMHFVLNVVVFAIMGLGFEERVGRPRLLVVFLASGVFGTLVHSLVNIGGFSAEVPVVGASGAVFGVMGAYATLYPRDKVVLFFILILPNTPVYLAAIAYTALELFALGFVGGGDGVARYAHVGGLMVGVLVALALSRALPEGRLERRVAVEPETLERFVETPEQRALYERLVANKDEPELAQAWLEKLARQTPCPECGERLEAAKGALRCNCGFKASIRSRRVDA